MIEQHKMLHFRDKSIVDNSQFSLCITWITLIPGVILSGRISTGISNASDVGGATSRICNENASENGYGGNGTQLKNLTTTHDSSVLNDDDINKNNVNTNIASSHKVFSSINHGHSEDTDTNTHQNNNAKHLTH